jgi:hypothetical protein
MLRRMEAWINRYSQIGEKDGAASIGLILLAIPFILSSSEVAATEDR